MPESSLPPEALRAAESAIRDQVRIRLGPRALSQATEGQPIMLSGREAETAARVALDALVRAGLAVVPAADYRHVLDRAEQFAMHRFDADDSILVARLRAALPEETGRA